MHAFVDFPSQLHWSAEQLADAVPLRLHELTLVDIGGNATAVGANARARLRDPLRVRDGLTPPESLRDVFRIR